MCDITYAAIERICGMPDFIREMIESWYGEGLFAFL